LAASFDLDGPMDEVRSGIRSIIHVDVTRIADSCGYVVPLMEYRGERSQMPKWQAAQRAKHGENAVLDYSAEHNERSTDHLPVVRVHEQRARERVQAEAGDVAPDPLRLAQHLVAQRLEALGLAVRLEEHRVDRVGHPRGTARSRPCHRAVDDRRMRLLHRLRI